jgi:glycosyltransferase involved in cell wall biosynthesis
MTRFSIVVPTADRSEYLLHCLTTLGSLGDDYEVIIQDNSLGDETQELCEYLKHPFRYFRTKPVGMRQNWENGIANATGDYVTVLGDDDGFMPNGLQPVRDLLGRHEADLVTWTPHSYWWPDAPLEHKQDLLYLYRPENAAVPFIPRLNVRTFMESGELFSFEQLPMIYNSFVRKGLIDLIRQKDAYYINHDIPDVWSGIANGMYAKDGLHLKTPVTIRGIGGKSGGAGTRGKDYKKAHAALRKAKVKYCHPALVESMCLSIHVTSVKLSAYEWFRSELPDLRIDIGKVIDGMLYEIVENPARRNEILKSADELAKKYKHPFDLDAMKKHRLGVAVHECGWKDGYVIVDCKHIHSVKTIYDASVLAAAIIGTP